VHAEAIARAPGRDPYVNLVARPPAP
jgi:hypothetical protein